MLGLRRQICTVLIEYMSPILLHTTNFDDELRGSQQYQRGV